MKKSLIILSALGASLLSGGYLLGQAGGSASNIVAGAAPKQQRLIRVSTLRTAEAVQEFQGNVQVIQAKRQQLIEANAAMEKETNAAKKKELKAKVDDLFAKLNEDNQKMLKAYGFSIERNYILVPEVAHIDMLVSEEEAVRFQKAAAAAPKK